MALLLGLTLPLSSATTASAATAPGDGALILLGTSGLRWDDISDETPSLQAFANMGSMGALAVRTEYSTTCPIDGWLTINSGRRTSDLQFRYGDKRYCLAPEAPKRGSSADAPWRLPDWWRVERAQATSRYEPTLGLLQESFTAQDSTVVAVGPGAAFAAANANGEVAQYVGTPEGALDTDPNPSGFASALSLARSRGNVILVDLGSILEQRHADRAAQVRGLESRFAAVQKALTSNDKVALVSVGDSDTSQAHLHVVAFQGANSQNSDWPQGLVSTRSTRQPGLAQLTDVLPTLLTMHGISQTPKSAIGSLIEATPQESFSERQAALVDVDKASVAVQKLVPWFWNIVIISQLFLYVGATWILVRHLNRPARQRYLIAMRIIGVLYAAVPVSGYLANLLPWWRTDHPALFLALAVSGWAMLLAGITYLPPLRKNLLAPLGFISAVTASVLFIDVLFGSRLQTNALMGFLPIVGGRFYGLGNAAFALFATGMLLTTVWIANALVNRNHRTAAALTAAMMGLATAFVDGSPSLGSDFGGLPPTFVGFGFFALTLGQVRLNIRRVVALLGTGLGLVMTIAFLDWRKQTSEQSHLGRFVQSIIDGEAAGIIVRKASQNLEIMLQPIAVLVPFALIFVTAVVTKPNAWGARPLASAYAFSTTLHQGVLALGVLLGLGMILNDSGAVIPAVGAMLAIPLLIHTSATLALRSLRPAAATTGPVAEAPAKPDATDPTVHI